MIDQKRENLLNLALAATEVERRRVPELSAGYNSYSKTWEVIVQYQGDLAFLEGQGVRVTSTSAKDTTDMRSVSIVIVRRLPPVHKIPEGYNPAVKIHMGKNPCIQHG